MKTILVTGGAGFIGSSLIDKLLINGDKVITIDNFNDYYDPEIKKRNICEVKESMERAGINQGNFQLYRGDIRDKAFLELIFDKHKFDIIVHLAAMAGVRYSLERPELYYDVNITGTFNLLESSRLNGINKFIFGSSSSVYGNNEKVPFNEGDVADYPISPYAASKRAGELICYTFHHLYKMNIACLRFFTVYGPRQRPDLAIHKFVKLIMEGESIPFYGEGTTQRDYTYIDNIIEGILKTIDYLQLDKKQYEIFNLGNSQTVSLLKMVQTIEAVLEKPAIINKLPMQPGDVNRTYADITKAARVLGYSPHMHLKDGIKNFVKWFNNDAFSYK